MNLRTATTPITLAMTLAALLLPGIASADKEAAAPAPPATEAKREGRLLTVRGAMQAEPQLTDRKGERLLLQGEWREELLRLDGHMVRVWGATGEKKLMTPTLNVSRYEILSTGYGTPLVGRLVASDSGALSLKPLGDGDAEKLGGSASMKRRLRKRAGCKIWVVGKKPKKKGAVRRVRTYGWLSCDPAAGKPQDKVKKTPGQTPPAKKPGPAGSSDKTKKEDQK